MEKNLDKCCGIDVHHESLTACIMKSSGKGMYKEIKEFSTFTDGIQALDRGLESTEWSMLPLRVQEFTGSPYLIFWQKNTLILC